MLDCKCLSSCICLLSFAFEGFEDPVDDDLVDA